MCRGSSRANLVARQPLTVCGLPLLPLILEAYGEQWHFSPRVNDGEAVEASTVLGTVCGDAALLLQAERLLLNSLQHLSGIATQTAGYVAVLGDSSTRLLDTRKTTPGLRMLEKYAVARGGAWNHRLGLFDRILFKDNHWACRGMKGLFTAITQARQQYPDILIEVEVDSCAPIELLLETGIDIILLDNFPREALARAVTQINGRAYSEASGSINRDNLPGLAHLGLDFVSVGALTHQSVWVDIGLDWLEDSSEYNLLP